jgi:hypothetical protein
MGATGVGSGELATRRESEGGAEQVVGEEVGEEAEGVVEEGVGVVGEVAAVEEEGGQGRHGGGLGEPRGDSEVPGQRAGGAAGGGVAREERVLDGGAQKDRVHVEAQCIPKLRDCALEPVEDF